MPIANKYREGKMKRTLERELKVPEIAKREAVERATLADVFFRGVDLLLGVVRSEGCTYYVVVYSSLRWGPTSEKYSFFVKRL